jgi:pyrroloquinoline-quinone synthase
MPVDTATPLAARLKEVIAARSLLDHPFYQEWTAGTLSRKRMKEYARQYYYFESQFPRFLSAIHARTDSAAIRQRLLENLWDEEHGERNHPALWLDFAAALGLSAREVKEAKLRPETVALVDHFQEQALGAPLAEALATLYAYESQVPAIAWQKIRGLSEHYGMRPDQFEFFSVHLVTDIAHAGAEVDSIESTCTDEQGVVRATEEACDRLLAFLDGCYGAKG